MASPRPNAGKPPFGYWMQELLMSVSAHEQAAVHLLRLAMRACDQQLAATSRNYQAFPEPSRGALMRLGRRRTTLALAGAGARHKRATTESPPTPGMGQRASALKRRV